MKTGCPSPHHCHRVPRCRDGCEDPDAVKQYKKQLEGRLRVNINDLRRQLRKLKEDK